jgi:hypothetical protein
MGNRILEKNMTDRMDIIARNGNDGEHYKELTYREVCDAVAKKNQAGREARQTQVGGDHYSKMNIQPIDFITQNNLSFIQGNIIKYVCRYKDKNGLQDLKKAQHYMNMLLEIEYGVGQRKSD